MKNLLALSVIAVCVSCQATTQNHASLDESSAAPAVLESEETEISSIRMGAFATVTGDIVDMKNFESGTVRSASFAEETRRGIRQGNPIGIATEDGVYRLTFEGNPAAAQKQANRPTGRHWKWGANIRNAASANLQARITENAGATLTVKGIWTAIDGKPALLVKGVR